jgi:hypothetical protein
VIDGKVAILYTIHMTSFLSSWTGPLGGWFATGPGTTILVLIVIWSALWKGFGLWRAARNGSKIWFVVLLLVNTVGILEILYIFVFSKMGRKKDVPPQTS